MSLTRCIICLLAASISATTATAQPTSVSTPSTQPQLEVIKLTLHPVPVTDPALRYMLLPPMTQRRSGNGAALYMIGATYLPPITGPDNKQTQVWNQLDQQLAASPNQFSIPNATAILNQFSFRWFDDAARCDFADWNPDFRGHGVHTLLPHLNYTRAIADAQVLRARLHIAQDNFPQAQYAIQSTLSLAHQLDRDSVLIEGLVAAGIDRLALGQAIEMWITRPNAPNLYWPLANLPQPMIDLHAIQDGEQSWLAYSDPRFALALAGKLPADQWRSTIEQAATLQSPGATTPPDLAARYDRLIQTLLPQAKDHLRQAGRSEQEIAALPLDQLVGQFMIDQYQTLSDQTWKAWLLPYPQAIPLLQQAHDAVQQAQAAGNVFATVIPNTAKARATFEQLNQHIATLEVIEALRDYAAHHNNTLPDRLDQVTDLPIPNDPVTTQPFGYHRDGTIATLDLAEVLNRPITWKYELSIAP